MANEDISSSVDDETRGLVRSGYSAPRPKPASGDKFIKELDRFTASSRDGKSTK
jgi:hypothetical protein